MSPSDQAVETLLTPELAPPLTGAISPGPYNFRFSAADALRLTIHNSQSGVVVAVHYRVLTDDHGIVSTVYQAAPVSDRTADAREFVIGEGFLLNTTVFASSGSPRRGQTFVRLQVIHGRGASATVLGTIVQGYITGNQDRAWPGSPLEGSLEGDGYVRTIVGTTPPVGAEFTESVPTGARWQLLSFFVTFITSATVATRRPRLLMGNGASGAVRISNASTWVASESKLAMWSIQTFVDNTMAQLDNGAPLPADFPQVAGDRIQGDTVNRQAGDQYASPLYVVREWLEAQ
jgi:hypothetical protein